MCENFQRFSFMSKFLSPQTIDEFLPKKKVVILLPKKFLGTPAENSQHDAKKPFRTKRNRGKSLDDFLGVTRSKQMCQGKILRARTFLRSSYAQKMPV